MFVKFDWRVPPRPRQRQLVLVEVNHAGRALIFVGHVEHRRSDPASAFAAVQDADGIIPAGVLPVTRDAFRERSARPIGGTGETYLDRAAMTAGQGAGTAEPSGGGGERLRGRGETDRRGTLSHLVLLPAGQPFFLGPSTLVGSIAEIILADSLTEIWSPLGESWPNIWNADTS